MKTLFHQLEKRENHSQLQNLTLDSANKSSDDEKNEK